MEYRQLGRDGPQVSLIGLGAWPIGDGMGVVDDELAVAWVLRRSALTCALVGAKSPAQVKEHLGAVGVTFAADELAAIDRIRADAPQG